MTEEAEKKIIIAGAPQWVVTFGDLMSLLLCFFVLLLSFSEMDKAKYKEVCGSLKKAFGVQSSVRTMSVPKGVSLVAKDFDQPLIPTMPKDEFVALQKRKEVEEKLKEEIEKGLNEMDAMEGMEDLISVEAGEKEVTIRMMGETAFDSGKAYIRSEMRPILKNIASILKEQEGEITVVGHTDNVPVIGGPYRSNLGLSMARSASVAYYLINEGGIDDSKISTMGFGEYRPIAPNDTPEGRQQNRRVEIKLKSPPLKR